MTTLFQFFNMSFPKAGVLFSAIPVTIANILFGVTLIKVFFSKQVSFRIKYFGLIYILFSFFVIISALINIKNAQPKQIAQSIVLIISPLSILIGFSIKNTERAIKVIATSLIVVSLYSLAQWKFGLFETTIEGLNLAYGDSWYNKPIAYRNNGYDLVKIPSTYQNGNLLAAFLIIAIPLMLTWNPIKKKYRNLKYTSIFLALIALILSGARSAFLPFILIFPFLILYVIKYLKGKTRYLFLTFLLLGFSIFLLILQIIHFPMFDFLINRYVEQTLADTTMSGRTIQFETVANQISNLDLLSLFKFFIVGLEWTPTLWLEGVAYIAIYHGLIPMMLYCALLLKVIIWIYLKANNKLVAFGLLAGFLQMLLDSPFVQPPTLINWFLISGIAIRLSETSKENV